MKRTITALFTLLALATQAQTLTTFLRNNENYFELRTITETHDGNIILNCPIFEMETGSDIGRNLVQDFAAG
jgi:hypothetical protein